MNKELQFVFVWYAVLFYIGLLAIHIVLSINDTKKFTWVVVKGDEAAHGNGLLAELESCKKIKEISKVGRRTMDKMITNMTFLYKSEIWAIIQPFSSPLQGVVVPKGFFHTRYIIFVKYYAEAVSIGLNKRPGNIFHA